MPKVAHRDTYHHGDIAKTALEIALRVINEKGEDGLSLRKVASELGVAHRALYHHYSDKDALIAAVSAAGYRALEADLAAAQDRNGFAQHYVSFALGRPRLYELMMRHHASTAYPALSEAVTAVIMRARAAIGGDRQVQRVWALLHGGVSLHALGAVRARDADSLTAFLLSLLEET